MQPLSSVAARRPIVSGAGTRHRPWGCCSLGGLLALMALVGSADAGPRDGGGRAARHAGRTAAAPARAPRPADTRTDALRNAHRKPESRAATAYRAPEARSAASHRAPELRAALQQAPDVRAAAPQPAPPPAGFAPTERTAGHAPPSRPPRDDADVPAAEPVHLALRREAFRFSVPAEPSPGLPRAAFADDHGSEGSAWKPARSRWGFEHGRLAVQLDGGTRLSLRARRGGLAISLKRNF